MLLIINIEVLKMKVESVQLQIEFESQVGLVS